MKKFAVINQQTGLVEDYFPNYDTALAFAKSLVQDMGGVLSRISDYFKIEIR